MFTRFRSGRSLVRCTLLVIISQMVVTSLPAQQHDPFALGVRDTEPLTPQEQLATFQLPPGFQIQLVAAEPQIAKPMNLAFDTRGRLWVSSSEEYPFAAKEDSVPRDTVKILEDTNGDGLFDRVTTFADQLNIPIGLYPYKDGVICFSIPNILFLRDTDGDDRCDVREVLYGPFDTTRDTHGMNNSFRRGDDGWIYACHGFNNRSEVTGGDGHTVTMTSGNTYRFRPDGSRIEHFTYGQVNPFGMAIDRFGDIYTADCHTKPVTLLLQGGQYESFGRPHDGLGFVPNVMDHLHGSTAIGGIALGQHTAFPRDFQQSSFGGNVMTSRINRNTLRHQGSSVRAVEQPDLLSTTDPWFRPVDLVAGPDGSLYVADFYNRIIGHYEVDLMHPGRDRFRGRLWKITYVGEGATDEDEANADLLDITQLTPVQLVEALETALYQKARMIADHITDNLALHAAEHEACVTALNAAINSQSPQLQQRALRLLHRIGELPFADLVKAAANRHELVRVHAFRALNEARDLPGMNAAETVQLLLTGFGDASPLVQRAAVLAAARHPHQALADPLLTLFHDTPSKDVHLRHVIRMTLRDHLKNDAWFREITNAQRLTRDRDIALIAELCLALKTEAAGEFIATHLTTLARATPEQLADLVQFAAGYVSADSATFVAKTVQQQFAENESLQLSLLTSMSNGFALRGIAAPPAVRQWAEQRAAALLGMSSPDDLEALKDVRVLPWHYVPHPDSPHPENPWIPSRTRRSSDGQQHTPLHSSFEAGETRTGILRSSPFPLTDTLSFYVAGHDGIPNMPLKGRNWIRLRDAADNALLLETPPRRNDVAQKVEWDTSAWRGRQAVVELVDGDNASAYAWLAAGRFSIDALNPSNVSQRRSQACDLIARFQLTSLQPAIREMLTFDNLDRADIQTLVTALVALEPDARMAAVSLIPSIHAVPVAVVQSCIDIISHRREDLIGEALAATSRVASSAEQLRMAEQLVADAPGAALLVSLTEQGILSARILNRPSIQQRLLAIADADLRARIDQLTQSLPDEDAAIERLIVQRRRDHAQRSGDVSAGAELFKKNCQICHQVAGEGKKVGPNLDGLGNRGLDRVVEDVLAPNRNVDIAFRTTTLVTIDGRAVSGLVRELEDNQLSLVDSQGKEYLLSADDVEERLLSSLSPMPANVAEILTDQQFHDLLAYLLSLKH